MTKSTFKKPLLSLAMAHIEAQYEADKDWDRYESSIMKMLIDLEELWKGQKSWFDTYKSGNGYEWALPQPNIEEFNRVYGELASEVFHKMWHETKVKAFEAEKPTLENGFDGAKTKMATLDESLLYKKIGENTVLDWNKKPIDWSAAKLEDVPVDWVPEPNQEYWNYYKPSRTIKGPFRVFDVSVLNRKDFRYLPTRELAIKLWESLQERSKEDYEKVKDILLEYTEPKVNQVVNGKKVVDVSTCLEGWQYRILDAFEDKEPDLKEFVHRHFVHKYFEAL